MQQQKFYMQEGNMTKKEDINSMQAREKVSAQATRALLW
jgi:hypothetical protein